MKTIAVGVAVAATLCVTVAFAVQDGHGQDGHGQGEHTQDAAFMPSPEMIKAMSPGPQHGQLAALAGKFNAEVRMRMGPEAPWDTMTAEAEREMIMDGRQLQEIFNGDFMGMPFHGQSLIGYDNLREQYHNVWFDNMSTGVMVVTGTADDSGAITFTGNHSDPMTMEKNKWGKSVMSADGSLLEMYTKTPDGAEFKSMTIAYTRK